MAEKNPEKMHPTIDKLVSFHYQQRFLKLFLFISSAGLVVDIIYRLSNSGLEAAVFDIVVLISLGVSSYALYQKHFELAASLAILSVLSLLLYAVITAGLGDATIFWFFTFPVLAFLLKGKRGGAIWLLLLVLIVVSIYLASYSGIISTIDLAYDALTFRHLILSLFIVSIFAYVYQDNLDQKETILDQREEQLSKIYTELTSEVKQQRHTAFDLSESLYQIRQEKARDEALLESIGEGVVAINSSGEIMTLNSAARKLFNLQSAELEQVQWYQDLTLVNAEGQKLPKAKRPLQKTLESGQKQSTDEYYYLDYNDQAVPVAITTTPVRMEGEIAGAIEIFRDITQKRKIAHAKDEFVSLASHQLRTPLSSIKWHSEALLQKNSLGENAREYVQSINESSERMSDLIDDFLNVSRFELGTLELNLTTVKLKDTIQQVLENLQPMISSKKLEVKQKLPDSTLEMQTDKSLLVNIIENLVSNAVKYTPEKGKVVVTASETEYRGQPMVQISIEDTGIGIPPGEQEQIFGKLFRAKNALSHNIGGTGLGLYIVKATVDALEGSIWFDSSEDKGTNFVVRLPREYSQQQQNEYNKKKG